MRIGALAAMTVLLVVPARAGELAGVTLPDQVTVEGKTLSLNGLGLRQATWLKVNVYVAALYLETKSSESEAIIGSEEVKRIVMRFVRGVGRKDIVKAWNESFEENAGEGMAALRDRVATLNSFMSDLAKGDAITFTYLPDRGVTVEVQGQTKGSIPGSDFARALFGIWLGPKPPNPGLKAGLLGKE
ncbi:MAG TPA: chalcone isomerase family protein [Candidatus Polarisedimenticolia bacterium]|nr:chalcone isomerase family protein [Candidatus Polarisedimenticolia bacterium]